MALEEFHTDRARAESFGSVAEQYDRYRPTCPAALVDDLVALRPTQVLDVACGTGKAAVAFAQRDLPVLGVEPDQRMADLARGHGIRVEVAAFETWDDAGRQFDLITCADAWHWINPELGVPKAARLLRPGGTIARFWNYHTLDDHVLAAFDAVYRSHAPDIHRLGRAPAERADTDPFADSDAFSPVETRTYRWERTLTADDWVQLAATFSDHQCLGHERLTTPQNALHAAIETLGGIVHAYGGTHVRLAHRA